MLTARAVRRSAIAVCVAGVAGMIAGSVAESTGAALTAGLVSAVAVLCLLVATAVGGDPSSVVNEVAAADVERRVATLVADGADEAQVRALVRAAVRLGRRAGPTSGDRDPSVEDDSCR